MDTRALVVILVIAGCTFLTRCLPFVLFGGKHPQGQKTVAYLGNVLPFCVIPILVLYCIREISLFCYPFGLPQLIAIAVVILVHIYKRNDLLSIAAGTFAYMMLLRLF